MGSASTGTRKAGTPFRRWFARLPPAAAARVTVALFRLAQGNTSCLRPVGGGVAEPRPDLGPGYRVYLAQGGARLVLLLGGTKARQGDVAGAKARWAAYERRGAGSEG